LKLRTGEKAVYREMNQSVMMKFPIQVDVALPAHKVSIIIQSVLGGIEFPTDEKYSKLRLQYVTDRAIVFKAINRLIRCIIDMQLHIKDSVSALNALMLARSLGGSAWDDSPLQMKQIDAFGIVAVRRLVNAGITSIEELQNTESHRIETILSKRPPYGLRILAQLKSFPKLRVSMQMKGYQVRFAADTASFDNAERNRFSKTGPGSGLILEQR
jgi:ATP-dependent DNA helicase HFM1/MER3